MNNNKNWWVIEIRIGSKKGDIKELCLFLVD